MLGHVTQVEFRSQLVAAVQELRKELEGLRTDLVERIRKAGSPPTASELAAEALKKILEQVNPREFIENLLVTKGLTLEALVRNAVAEEFKGVKFDVVEDVSDRVWEDIDLDDLSSKVADRLVKIVWAEAKDEIIEAIVERLAEDAWENLDMDGLYPHIGEKVVNRMAVEKKIM